jgi:hypothetical protein
MSIVPSRAVSSSICSLESILMEIWELAQSFVSLSERLKGSTRNDAPQERQDHLATLSITSTSKVPT